MAINKDVPQAEQLNPKYTGNATADEILKKNEELQDQLSRGDYSGLRGRRDTVAPTASGARIVKVPKKPRMN